MSLPLKQKPESLGKGALNGTPHHIAIIMDGNQRWARKQGLPVRAGHKAGAENLRTLLQHYTESEIYILTLFAFSSENWKRPSQEVSNLWGLFEYYLKHELDELTDKGVHIRFIGNRARLSTEINEQMRIAEQCTNANNKHILAVAIDYGGRWDIVNAVRQISMNISQGDCNPEDIDEQYIRQHLSLGDLGYPDLCIRTGGEQRISNFMLWQMAYTEFYFSDLLWPDFDVAAFELALEDYCDRPRRFGRRASN